MANEERLRELEEKYEGYTVYDNQGSKIGKVDDLFVDESDSEEYIGVKMGFLGTKSTLIPTEVVRVNEPDRTIEVSESKDHVKDAPSFSDDDDITADYEERIRSHFGLGASGFSDRGSYGGGSSSETAAGAAGGATGGATAGSATADEGRGDSSGTDAEYGEHSGSTTDSTGGEHGTGEHGDRTGTSGHETDHGDTAATGAATGGAAAGGATDGGDDQQSGASSGREGSTTGQPSTTRQTEETETFQEGGRTKIRRRTIIEEVVDADEQ